mgnify:CR=1 FL=1
MAQKEIKPFLDYEELSDVDKAVTGKKYRLLTPRRYYSKKHRKWVFLEKGFLSDGATGAFDIHSWAWWIHDKLCEDGTWADGTPCNNFQASTVLGIILAKEKRYLRSIYWWWATWLVGGGQARKNGMW